MVTEQLERSFLERKERDELHAIAAALSLKASTRLKKADIIDLILQATVAPPNGDAATQANGGKVQPSVSTSFDQTSSGANPDNSQLSFSADGVVGVAQNDSEQTPVPKKRTRKTGKEKASASSQNTGDSVTAEEKPLVTAASSTDAGSQVVGSIETDPAKTPDFSQQETTQRGESHSSSSLKRTPQAANSSSRVVKAAQPEGDVTEAKGEETVKKDDTQSQPSSAQDMASRKSRRRRGRDRGERSDTPAGGNEAQWQGELVMVRGLLDLKEDGYGFLRTTSYLASSKDVYVSVSQVRRFGLRKGDAIEGACRPAASNEKYPALIRIDTIDAIPADEVRNRPRFEDLTPLFPDEPLRLELANDHSDMTARIVDLISPIGKGQRGMIVSPPKAGKTTIMKQIARSIEANNPDVHLIVLLVDERPEEVTDMRRSVRGEVVASTFDRPSDEHTQVAELTIERAKRLVELGKDVVIILDGITRLARAYNLSMPATGRIMSGGVDSGALYPPKKFFGAARNVEEGGSLTILATALVETGSKMDEVIFEEFKGTGNMELRLDRRLAERRLYPAIDVNASSTRHEELLFERSQLQQVWKLRRVLNAIGGESNSAAGLELLLDKLKTTRSNDEFLAEIAKSPTPG